MSGEVDWKMVEGWIEREKKKKRNYFPDKMFKSKVQTHSFALLAVSSFFQGSIHGLKNVVRSVGFTLVSVSIPQTLENAS